MVLEKTYEIHKIEEKWAKIWFEKKIYAFQENSPKPPFVIDTPPPYPSGDLHMGNFLNWTYFDIVARYKRMRGFNILMPQGWDEHGLPTEVKVEQKYNLRRHTVDRKKFVALCKEYTEKFIKKMKSQFLTLGFSLDWSREYRTSSADYIRKTQLSFLLLYEKGLIYRGKHPVNWCPRCETAISDAEVEYITRGGKFNYITFKVEDSDILVATTRPELLASCVAVAVNPKDARNNYLINKKAKVPIFGHEVPIIADNQVDISFGTGIVMICTFGDRQDVEWVNRHNLPVRESITETGVLNHLAQKYEGMDVNECKEAIIEDLRKEGFLRKQEPITQNIGVCWRCDTPIEILSRSQWFIKIKEHSKSIVENASKIKWYPPHMQQRLIDWASSLDWDWVISRQRIFGTPFPLWYCKACKEVILADKSALPIDPTQTAPDKPCPKCGSHEYIPEMDGMDTWMDSSITIAVHAGWPDDPNWTKYFPADIQPNGTDIIRTWDYYLLLRHLMLFDQIPFKAVLINGMVTGEDGRKMSKSLNNFVTTESAVKEYGVDALRQWAAAGGSVGSDIPFTWKEVKHAFRFLVKYWNAIRFVSMHLKEYRLKEPVKLNPFDRWILEKLNNVIIDVTKNMEEYRFNIALNTLRSFIWHDFCDNYLECVKYRLYDKTIAQSEIESAKYTLATVINTTLKLFAPFIPFFTEEVYNNLFTTKFQSIHLTTWPEKLDIKEELEKLGDIAIEIIKTVRKLKSRANQPLNKEIDWIKVRSSNYALKMFIEDIRRTIKAKEIQIKEGTTGYPVSDDLFLEISPIECKKCKKKTYDLAQGKCMAC